MTVHLPSSIKALKQVAILAGAAFTAKSVVDIVDKLAGFGAAYKLQKTLADSPLFTPNNNS